MPKLRSRLEKLEARYLDENHLVIGSDAWLYYWLDVMDRSRRGEKVNCYPPMEFLEALQDLSEKKQRESNQNDV